MGSPTRLFLKVALCGLLPIGQHSAFAAERLADTAAGEPPPFYLHVGAAGLLYSESATMNVAGMRLAGATVAIGNVPSFAVEAGAFVLPDIAISAAAGYPPLSKVVGAGTLAGIGTLGKAVGGPMSLSAHYHLRELGPFQPYIGAGLAALIIFDAKDGAINNLKVQNAVGPMVQGGFDVMIDQQWGMFVDVKKSWIDTKATGLFAGAPITSKLVLNPLVLSSGLTYRF